MDDSWVDNFIERKTVYTAYDETGTIIIGKFNTYKEAKEAILNYTKTLKKESTLNVL